MDLAILADKRVKIKGREKIDNDLELAENLEITIEHVDDGGTNFSWDIQDGFKRLENIIGTVGDRRKNQDHSD